MQAVTQNYLKSYINNKPLVRLRLPERQVIYNDHIIEPDELPEFIRQCSYCRLDRYVLQEDIPFLTELYERKVSAKLWHAGGWLVPSNTFLGIFVDFCEHFRIESFQSRKAYTRSISKTSFPRSRFRVLFLVLPLTKGEYTCALKAGLEKGVLTRERLNRGKRKRYIYYLNGGDSHGQR